MRYIACGFTFCGYAALIWVWEQVFLLISSLATFGLASSYFLLYIELA